MTEPTWSELEGATAAQTSPLRSVEVIRLCDVEDLPPRPDLIEGVVPDRFPTSVYGAGGQLKTYLAIHMGVCVASGEPFLGRAVTQGAVLFVDWELDQDVTARRARQLARGLGLADIPSEVFYLNAAKPLMHLLLDIQEAISTHSIRLVVIDSMGLAISGDNQSEEGVIPAMGALRALGIASVVIDHQARIQTGQDYSSKEQFGSVYKGNLSRMSWQLERADPGTDAAVVELVMRNRKANFGPLQSDLGLRVTFASDAITVSPVDVATTPSLASKAPAREQVFAAVVGEPGSTADTIADVTGVAMSTVKNSLTELYRLHRVTRVSTSRREPAQWYPVNQSEYPDRDTQYPDGTLGASIPESHPPKGGVCDTRDTRSAPAQRRKSQDTRDTRSAVDVASEVFPRARRLAR
ncbi:MAG: AAA family ATPase [Candidatus Dormiibacterota bacterium]